MTTKMMDENNYDPQILDEYIRMARDAQVLEADFEYGHDVVDEFSDAVYELAVFRAEHGISKEALTAYRDKKRGVRKASNLEEALSHMEDIFGQSRGQ